MLHYKSQRTDGPDSHILLARDPDFRGQDKRCMDTLWAPWRMTYMEKVPPSTCLSCKLAYTGNHVVPRWSGDTNFMPVVGATKVIPEHPAATHRKLASLFRSTGKSGEGDAD